jgi:uncharacterized protein Veg
MGKGIPLSKILKLPVKAKIGRKKELTEIGKIKEIADTIDSSLGSLEVER